MSTTLSGKKELAMAQQKELIGLLKARFEKNMNRHKGIQWAEVESRLDAHPEKLWSLSEMEKTGGEPDVVCKLDETGEYIFYDFSPETPQERRNLCYDREALDARKTAKPGGSAIELATAMGIELLDEEQYYELQGLGEFDLKTSSWLKTPDGVRKKGGALYGDRRYGRVFIYHNGAQSYYAVRGFRGFLKV